MLVTFLLPIISASLLTTFAPIILTTGTTCTETYFDPNFEKVVDEMFLPVRVNLTKYPSTDLTADLWLYVSGFLDAISLWNLSLTCKTVGAILRQVEGFPTLFKKFQPSEVLDMLAESELPLGDWADLLLTRDNLARMKMIKEDSKKSLAIPATGKVCLMHEGEKAIFDAFIAKARSVLVEGILHVRIGNRNFIEVDIPDLLKENVFYFREVMSCSLYYLPEAKEKKLFDLIDPSIAGKLTWRKADEESWSLFSPSILADYVIPAWRGEYTLSSHEKSCIRALVKSSSSYYQRYFDNLIWALFFMTGTDPEINSTTIQPLIKFLEDLGFSWYELMQEKTHSHMNHRAEIMKENMQYIYATALQWGLDLKKLAEATPYNRISTEVCNGIVPVEIIELAEINERSIINLSHHFFLPSLRKVEVKDGKFCMTGELANLRGYQQEFTGQLSTDPTSNTSEGLPLAMPFLGSIDYPVLLNFPEIAMPAVPTMHNFPPLPQFPLINGMDPRNILDSLNAQREQSLLRETMAMQLVQGMPRRQINFPQYQMPQAFNMDLEYWKSFMSNTEDMEISSDSA